MNVKPSQPLPTKEKFSRSPLSPVGSHRIHSRRVIALAAKCDFPVYVAEVVERFEVISISAGLRGLQILIAPPDYLSAANGTQSL